MIDPELKSQRSIRFSCSKESENKKYFFLAAECKVKWKHIRDYYQRQKRAGKKRTGSPAGSPDGSPSGSGRPSRYDSLQFLEASFVERK